MNYLNGFQLFARLVAVGIDYGIDWDLVCSEVADPLREVGRAFSRRQSRGASYPDMGIGRAWDSLGPSTRTQERANSAAFSSGVAELS